MSEEKFDLKHRINSAHYTVERDAACRGYILYIENPQTGEKYGVFIPDEILETVKI